MKESGLYFISALITLKDAAGKFEVGELVHIYIFYFITSVNKLSRSRQLSVDVRIVGILTFTRMFTRIEVQDLSHKSVI